ncbi:MAG: adenylate/guanylate cyclase domain-containing protein [Alphaproteobacteria bacterium]
MGADEDGTLAALKAHRAVTKPIGEGHGGRVVGTAGDGELWEFLSVTEAVLCAVEVQDVMAARNSEVPEERQMLYRIRINPGDVMIDGAHIHGDGVNIAARLEALAAPGASASRKRLWRPCAIILKWPLRIWAKSR